MEGVRNQRRRDKQQPLDPGSFEFDLVPGGLMNEPPGARMPTLPGDRPVEPAARRPQQPVIEIVDDIVALEVDVNTVHDAVAALLIHWWRSNHEHGAVTQ
jgi:hypothetical protein